MVNSIGIDKIFVFYRIIVSVYQFQVDRLRDKKVTVYPSVLSTNKKVRHYAILISCSLTEVMKLGIFHGNSSRMVR